MDELAFSFQRWPAPRARTLGSEQLQSVQRKVGEPGLSGAHSILNKFLCDKEVTQSHDKFLIDSLLYQGMFRVIVVASTMKPSESIVGEKVRIDVSLFNKNLKVYN